MREGHLSVFEHARYVFGVTVGNIPEITEIMTMPGTHVERRGREWIISVNGSHLVSFYKKNRVIRAMYLQSDFNKGEEDE